MLCLFHFVVIPKLKRSSSSSSLSSLNRIIIAMPHSPTYQNNIEESHLRKKNELNWQANKTNVVVANAIAAYKQERYGFAGCANHCGNTFCEISWTNDSIFLVIPIQEWEIINGLPFLFLLQCK